MSSTTTTDTTTDTTTGVPAATRARVGWGDLLWLTWRQHRWTVLGSAVVVAGLVALSLAMAVHVDATGDTHRLFGRWRYLSVSQFISVAPMALGLAVAVFWAAPLLSREYEQRTNVLVWSQDVSALRWLTGKVVLLGATAVALAVGLGMASIKLMNSVNAVATDYPPFRPFDPPSFEAAPQVQAGYAVFGFALGLAFSAVTRRTVLSMGLTAGAFIVTRGVVAGAWRPYYQEPLRRVEPYSTFTGWDPEDGGGWMVNGGFVDGVGNLIPFPEVCSDVENNALYAKCMEDNNVRYVSDYHPMDRLVPFQWFEAGVFAALAAGLLVLAFVWVRRARRV